MKHSSESLAQQIEREVERLLQEHMAACEAAAEQAVRSAFGKVRAARSGRLKAVPAKGNGSRSKGTPSRKRSAEQLSALAEQLYRAICEHPGQTMAVLSSVVGQSGELLRYPARRLLRQQRIRCIGERQAKRYFPVSPGE